MGGISACMQRERAERVLSSGIPLFFSVDSN
jgi:hypothetical protein